jgi:hypothetical protein
VKELARPGDGLRSLEYDRCCRTCSILQHPVHASERGGERARDDEPSSASAVGGYVPSVFLAICKSPPVQHVPGLSGQLSVYGTRVHLSHRSDIIRRQFATRPLPASVFSRNVSCVFLEVHGEIGVRRRVPVGRASKRSLGACKTGLLGWCQLCWGVLSFWHGAYGKGIQHGVWCC